MSVEGTPELKAIRDAAEEAMRKAVDETLDDYAVAILQGLGKQFYENSVAHGFSEERKDFGLKIALMHGELSEALEAERKDILVSDHIPDFTGVEEEFADTIIRIMSYSYANKLRLAEAILAKHKYNVGRPFMHGGKKF